MAARRTTVHEPVAGGSGVADTRERAAVREALERNAAKAQIFHTWGALNLGNTTVRRFMHAAASGTAATATENQSVVPAPAPGLLTRLRVDLPAPLTGVETTFTVLVNGDDTPLRVTVAAGQGAAVANKTVPVTDGDFVTLASDTDIADGAVSSFARATVLWRAT